MEFSMAGSIVLKWLFLRKNDTCLTYELYNIKFQFLNVKCVRSNFEQISANNRTLASHNFVNRKKLGCCNTSFQVNTMSNRHKRMLLYFIASRLHLYRGISFWFISAFQLKKKQRSISCKIKCNIKLKHSAETNSSENY